MRSSFIHSKIYALSSTPGPIKRQMMQHILSQRAIQSRGFLDLLQALLKLAPVAHHNNGAALLLQHLRHLVLLFALVRAHIADQRDLRILGRRRPAPAVFNRHARRRLRTEHLARVQVDRRVGLAGRLGQAGRRAEHLVGVEVLVHADLADGRLHTAEGRRADDGHLVLLALVQLLELGDDAVAWPCLLLQRLDHLA